MPQIQQTNVLMFGGKRCGKTTVLSSMHSEINHALEGTSLSLQATREMMELLNAAVKAIQDRMKEFADDPLKRIEVSDGPTDATRLYRFDLRVNNTSIPFNIRDIPGEWILDDAHRTEVQGYVREAQVILIAIDTPYLMSKMTVRGYGLYHEEYNRPGEILDFFQNGLSVEDLRDRMILFVPIKCERYYHLDRTRQLNLYNREYMRELKPAISAGYGGLIRYLRSTPELINHCTIAITPILSAGGIDFVRFRTDETTGRVISLYQRPEFLRPEEQGYHPQFCEQPMLYSIIFILQQQLMQVREMDGLTIAWNALLGHYINSEQLHAAIQLLRRKIKRGNADDNEPSKEGFFFIQNPWNI